MSTQAPTSSVSYYDAFAEDYGDEPHNKQPADDSDKQSNSSNARTRQEVRNRHHLSLPPLMSRSYFNVQS
jgi:hypothetical protein